MVVTATLIVCHVLPASPSLVAHPTAEEAGKGRERMGCEWERCVSLLGWEHSTPSPHFRPLVYGVPTPWKESGSPSPHTGGSHAGETSLLKF